MRLVLLVLPGSPPAPRLCTYSVRFCLLVSSSCWNALMKLYVGQVLCSLQGFTFTFSIEPFLIFPTSGNWGRFPSIYQFREVACLLGLLQTAGRSAFIERFLIESWGFKANMWTPEILCSFIRCFYVEVGLGFHVIFIRLIEGRGKGWRPTALNGTVLLCAQRGHFRRDKSPEVTEVSEVQTNSGGSRNRSHT